MVRSAVPTGPLVTAFMIGMLAMIVGYLIKYFCGAIPLQDIYQTKTVKEEYVSININYVLDSFMDSYRTRMGGRSKDSVYYLEVDEEIGAMPLRASTKKMQEEMERIIDETWDYLDGA